MADSNKYRRGTGTKYKDSALSEGQVREWLGRINRRGERKCIAMVKKADEDEEVCGEKFMSAGPHNRVCPKCKSKQENKYKNKITRESLEYRAFSQPEHITNSYRGE